MSQKQPVIFQALKAGLGMFRWVVLVLLVLFLISGITTIEQDKVGLLLRFGRLVGANPGEQVRPPGLVLALPYPIDRLIEIPGEQKQLEIIVDEVYKPLDAGGNLDSINPLEEGYVLTGDQNVVQAEVVAKYVISDPIQYQLWTTQADGPLDHDALSVPEQIIRDTVLAAFTQLVAGYSVDDVILQKTGGTETIAAKVQGLAQDRLAQLNCGMTLSGLAINQIHPPRHVISEFQAVNSSEIAKRTALQEAKGFRSRKLLESEAQRDRLVQEANAYKSRLLAQARADRDVFTQIAKKYHDNPSLVWRRVYLEAQEAVMENAGKILFASPGSNVVLPAGEGQP